MPAGFPLTDMQLAGAYAVISGHDAAAIDWSAYQLIPTLVVLMGGRQLGVIAQQLQQTGWSADTPVTGGNRAATCMPKAVCSICVTEMCYLRRIQNTCCVHKARRSARCSAGSRVLSWMLVYT